MDIALLVWKHEKVVVTCAPAWCQINQTLQRVLVDPQPIECDVMDIAGLLDIELLK
jgi:hypothetical protein